MTIRKKIRLVRQHLIVIRENAGDTPMTPTMWTDFHIDLVYSIIIDNLPIVVNGKLPGRTIAKQ